MIRPKSERLFNRAKKILVGGVNSPVRSFKSVGGHPLFIRKAKGPYCWDADGKRYIDLVQSWGALILGHGHPQVLAAARQAMNKGASYGACHENEILLAETLRRAFPKTIERVRLMSSGTEAAMTALRIARGATGRDFIVKFSGGYHGHHDSLLVAAGSGALTLGQPSSLGVPAAWAKTTIVVPYNDLTAVEETFKKTGDKIAAVIVEPAAANMGLVLPKAGFLEGLRSLTRRYGSLLIADEVITGFRLKWGGLADAMEADLVCLGKIIGGGFPIAAVGGAARFMDILAPLGGVYHAGTLSGNPVAVAGGLAALNVLKRVNPYPKLEARSKKFAVSLTHTATRLGLPFQVIQRGSLWTVFFTETPIYDNASAQKTDTKLFARFFQEQSMP
ncbi:MAG: glutamate-1-semialdehyde 2,1-aminomutase [Elusimicrobia bacterium]|nr:glutamate-1-semialdehyde 2,1-aminomutase [Elusimicrobiota bacterium]